MPIKNLMSFSLTVFIFLSLAPAARAIDPAQVEVELSSTGAVGWVHGAVKDRGLFVFSYRNPNDFFDFMNFSLAPADETVRAQLETLARHDRVRIYGAYLPNPSPQIHIEVTRVELEKKHAPQTGSGEPAPDYRHEAKIPDELLGKSEAHFLVHAVSEGGHILVVEYGDQVVPIFVKNPALTKDLYRNDIVLLKFKLQSQPTSPTHLRLDEKADEPVKVIEAIKDLHGKPADIEGALILFPKSPEVRLNVFALLQELPYGLKRQYTLVNFDDAAVFTKIREKLQQAWDRHSQSSDFVNGRNKFVSLKIRVRAVGVFNEIDPGQANAQILLQDENSITIFEN